MRGGERGEKRREEERGEERGETSTGSGLRERQEASGERKKKSEGIGRMERKKENKKDKEKGLLNRSEMTDTNSKSYTLSATSFVPSQDMGETWMGQLM